ncbi:MAG TPA: FMN-binding negative transcriptional regulator [Kiloniellales bacterium]|jgi:transcriptional regulator
MYIPKDFVLTDPDEIRAVLRDYAFAVLVTAVNSAAPVATHLPVIFDGAAGPNGTLLAHMARANPHWHDLERLQEAGGEALVIFQGAHTYVSPRWYSTGPAVPTWNYVAVHAYGTPRLIDDPARVRRLLTDLADIYEAGAAAPWRLEAQDDTYLRAMMRGIVAFEIPISRLEAKAKMTQNRSAEDRAGVIAALRQGADALGHEVATLMDRLPAAKRD